MKINKDEVYMDQQDQSVEYYVERLPENKKKYHGFTTLSLDQQKMKLILQEAKLQPTFKNAECLGKCFNCIGFFTDYVEIGYDDYKVRCILFDEDLNSYSTISAGVAKIITGWIDLEVEPSIENPVLLHYEQVRKGNICYYTIKLGE